MSLPGYFKLSMLAKWVLSMVITGTVLSLLGADYYKTSVFSRLIVRPKSLLTERRDQTSTASQNSHVPQAHSHHQGGLPSLGQRETLFLAVRRQRSNRQNLKDDIRWTPHSPDLGLHEPPCMWRGPGPERIPVSRQHWFQKALLHLHRWEPDQSYHHEIAGRFLQMSVVIQIAQGLSIDPSCWYYLKLLSSPWRQSKVACFAQCTFLVVVSW